MQQTTIASQDVTLEASLLKLLASRDNYNNYFSLIDLKRLFPNTVALLKDYKKYYSQFANHEHIDFGLLYTQFSQNWHALDMTTEECEYYRDYVFKAIKEASPDTIESTILGLLKKKTVDDIVSATTNKDLNPSKLIQIINDFELKTSNLLKTHDDEVATINTVDFTELDKANGIPFFLPSLQSSLGSLVKGQFVVVSADYGTGKSAFVISQTVATLKYLKENNDIRPILYFNSEGTSADIFGRVCSNIYKDKIIEGFEGIIKNSPKIVEHFRTTFTENSLLVIQMTNSNVDWLQNKIKKYNPALVIVDITDTLAPEEDVMNLKKVYDRLRLISGKYCPIIGTTQSGDTSYQDKETGEVKNKKWLGDHALYGSKTGKGGSADTIITIGKDSGLNSNLRYISTPKKKRGEPVNITCELIDKYSLYQELAW